ncbi:F-box protein CPR1-like [Diospyros lotus]|uniref:F-box protein CPR1-like n=1 Tax=Diospyros lotus TaxID=55363 RepID=UPI002252956E|nr:F-box protein CPR1-like [Diospyros lotus]XP_052181423.1 F-box protein CPR1-like [Diospyros lotus]XP_052181424.1 F-box protein CPR1-like [Diospyros lotus]XP_052181425.1 F-box protein CPR1-like [Diospyros lotus]
MQRMTEAHLPQELLVEILKRLPAKSLLRFRSVSKSWRSTISSPEFITLHRNHNINNTRVLVSYYPSELRALLHYDNDAFELDTKIEFPFERLSRYYRIVGSCNGLICVGCNLVSCASDLFLWNPSIRRILTLPTPGITFKSHGAYMLALGFGFDSKRRDYKVVRIVYLQGRNGFNKVPPEVELYELSTGTWRGISIVAPPYEMCDYSLQANMNGAVHWIAYSPTKINGLRSLIVAFDLSDDVFKEMRLPKTLSHEYPADLSIAACGELLSLFHYNLSSPVRCCGVWVMEKYGMDNSWTKLFNIELLQGVSAVLGSRKNGELLVVTSDNKLVSYDPDDEQVKDLGIRKSTTSLNVNTYTGSLILLDRTYGVLSYSSVPDLNLWSIELFFSP